jgi:hypothetical protein
MDIAASRPSFLALLRDTRHGRGIRDTAYPQLKSTPSSKELDEVYTPNFVELVWAEKRTREPAPRVGLLALLKTFQRLG